MGAMGAAGGAAVLLLPALLRLVRGGAPGRPAPWRRPAHVIQGSAGAPGRPSTANCTWRTFEQRLDHFGGQGGTFAQRYCLYDGFWHSGSGSRGPIFFYTGNESPLDVYVNNTGLMWEMGGRMGALLVFAEHRFEPLSHPCLQGTQNCWAYCTTAQALADYAALVAALRVEREAASSPVVAFGGSYGGMLAGWMRIRYPDVVAGSIAASAPVWGLAGTLEKERLDWTARAVTRGVSTAGGSPDRCLANLRAAWPLAAEAGKSARGLALLGGAAGSCEPLGSAQDFIAWAQAPWFLLAEANYPFPSTYITYSVGPGSFPLPPWPMRAACRALDRDFGVRLEGRPEDVAYTLRLGDLTVAVEWGNATGNGHSLAEGQLRASGLLELVGAVRDAVGVWYNVTGDRLCYDVASSAPHAAEEGAAAPRGAAEEQGSCPACPPCEGCPPCPVAGCEPGVCDFRGEVSKTFSWDGITCNDDIWLYNDAARGMGRDLYWPPSVRRNATVADVVGSPEGQLVAGCGRDSARRGLAGAPRQQDPWSRWATSYYGGKDIAHHRNIVWSQGLLDPWSGGGVYPPGGGVEGPLRQNISADGSQVALLIDLGGHHLDLFFEDPADPNAVKEVRRIEEEMVSQWCDEWRAMADEVVI